MHFIRSKVSTKSTKNNLIIKFISAVIIKILEIIAIKYITMCLMETN